nr:hypothetical protein [Treponema sp.]
MTVTDTSVPASAFSWLASIVQPPDSETIIEYCVAASSSSSEQPTKAAERSMAPSIAKTLKMRFFI